MYKKRTIFSLGLEINDVVYLRRDDKVIGAKYMGLTSDATIPQYTMYSFYRADGIEDSIAIFGCDSGERVYATIEDAIHDRPIKYNVVDITDLTKHIFCFSHEPDCVGAQCLGKEVWKWDGYKPKKVHISHTKYRITYNGVWSCKYIGKDKLYNTEEECRSDNPVEVITF